MKFDWNPNIHVLRKILQDFRDSHTQGTLDVEEFKRLLSPKTKMVAFVHISNTLGCINPVTLQKGKSF